MFSKYILDYPTNIFDELSQSVDFEDIMNGRKGANLVDYKNELIPIVRTTSNYSKPNQKFAPIHYDIIANIKKMSGITDLELNNALIEMYDSQYRNMKFHSDQSLDLADNSYICIFSCYDNPTNIRKLKIKNKSTGEFSEISLDHNSVVIFSTETNKKYQHKIILDQSTDKQTSTGCKWLGITFRFSKTVIKFIKDIPYFYPNGNELKLATDEDKKIFLKHKSEQNKQIGYNYPEISYTLSVGDLLLVN